MLKNSKEKLKKEKVNCLKMDLEVLVLHMEIL